MVDRIGPYELIADLGSGAMGKVYRARDTRLDREVALKVLWPQLAEQPAAVARFERESRAEARLRHPNVVGVFDVGASDGQHYLAMEYVVGCSLRELLKQPLPVDKALHYFKQILAGLGVAHEQGIIHRDLKPGNILLEASTDTLKLADFGLARIIEEENSITQSGEMLGTIEYMAPELSRGEGAGRQSDLYAAGVVLYRMLTGRFPFQGATPVAILKAHKDGTYPQATTIVGGLPPQADAVLARLLAREPISRYADCQAVFADIERWEKGEEIPREFAAEYEPIDHEIERHRVPGWKRAWQRVASWHRYQWLEAFNRTELTVVRVRDEVTAAETELGKARRRLEEATLLRNRVRVRAAEAQTEELEKEARELEQVMTLARQEYAARTAIITELRHRADLLLARRRRAKMEMSFLGILPVSGRRLGERCLAVTKLLGIILALSAGTWWCSRHLLPTKVVPVTPSVNRREQPVINPANAGARPARHSDESSSEHYLNNGDGINVGPEEAAELDKVTREGLRKNLVVYQSCDGNISADRISFSNPTYIAGGWFGKSLVIPAGGRCDYRLPGSILKEGTIMARVGIPVTTKSATFWQFDLGYPRAGYNCENRKVYISFGGVDAADRSEWVASRLGATQNVVAPRTPYVIQTWGPQGFNAYWGGVHVYRDPDQRTGIPLDQQMNGAEQPDRYLYVGNDENRQGGSIVINELAVFNRQLSPIEIFYLLDKQLKSP